MDQRRVLILAGILGILILAIIIGTIVYLTHSFQSDNSSTHVVTSTPTPTASIPAYTPSSPSARITPEVSKTYSGAGFQVQYPANWGLLTCSNSQNFELDPQNATDQKRVVCNRAVKSITVLVGPTSCQGQTVKLGNLSVFKSIQTSQGETDYRWCSQTTPILDITHRVSATGGKATSPTDYSPQIEEMISKIYFGSGS